MADKNCKFLHVFAGLKPLEYAAAAGGADVRATVPFSSPGVSHLSYGNSLCNVL